VSDVARVQQPVDRLIGGHDTGQRNHGDDEQASQVFGSSVAVRVALVRLPPSQPKGRQQRDSRQGVSDVVQCVAEQGDRAGQEHHNRWPSCDIRLSWQFP
jgi:hypothetical protein